MYYQNNRFKTPPSSRGQHSHNRADSYYSYPAFQPQLNTYPRHVTPQFQDSYYRQIDPNGPSRPPNHNFGPDHGQASGSRPLSSLQRARERGNMHKKQNQHKREKYNLQEDDNNKNFKCPNCLLHFEFSVRNYNRTGRLPLLLNCMHTVCQECISKEIVSNTARCPVCQKTSESSKKSLIDHLQEVFVPNFYVLGSIAWNQHLSRNEPKQCALVEVTKKNKKSAPDEQPTCPMELQGEKCGFLSCFKKAVLRCQDCKDIFCLECCTMVHKNVKAMWSHVQVQITNGSFSVELEKCPEHGAMDIEFYCSTCDICTCCYCFIEKHEGHEKEYLSKLSSEELNDLNFYQEKAKHVLKQLLISQRTLKEICSTGSSTVEKKIYTYFADLHGRLHFIQKKMLEELSGAEESNKPNVLAEFSSKLETSIRSLRYILEATENINLKKINLRGILQKLKDVELTPCYLLNDASANVTEFCCDPILENLDGLFKIKQFDNINLQLVSKIDLPPDYVEEHSDLQFEDLDSLNSSFAQSSKKEESNLYNKKISSQSQTSLNKPKESTQQRRRKIDKKFISDNEMVEVTHIESLECFYVQLKKQQTLFNQMNKDIDNYIKMGPGKVTSPEINELYLVLYVTRSDKIWCRGRVTEIKNMEDSTLYEIYFIDFGSTKLVDIDKLREITPHLAQKKPFAIQCELYNPAYASWGKNAHVYLGKIISGKELYMVVKSINNGVYQVDLMVASSDRGLTSIIDILIHTCANALSSSSDSLNSGQRKDSYVPELTIFSNSFKFQKNQTEKVILANVVDPHHVFVHMANYKELLKNMTYELKQHFKNKCSEACVIPVEGTYVLVEHHDLYRGNWHRAFVKKVDIFKRVAHVLLVDWGNVAIVPWSNVRMLTESFTRLESQAVLVKLAHVEPYQGSSAWSDRSVHFLEKNFHSQEQLKMVVYCIEPLEVALFEINSSVNVCINAQLVQEKLADSTGIISQKLEWSEDEEQQAEFLEGDGFVASLLKKVNENSDEESQKEEFDAKNYANKKQISITKVESPGVIYIKFVDLQEKELNMNRELQIHYNKDSNTKDSWMENEGCVVLYSNEYVRGKVICQVDDKYRINLYDKATEVLLPKERLFIHSDYFKKFPKFVFKCHLANIRPAGGNKWSLTSTEALESTFSKYKDIFATKVPGDPKNTSIPMLMWYTRIKIGSAFEQNITKVVSINKMLVKLGFAYVESNKTIVEDVENLENVPENLTSASRFAHKLNESSNNRESDSDEFKEKSSITSSVTNNFATSSSDWNELIEEEQRASSSKQDSPYHTREAEIIDWKPAFPIKKQEFKAWITCVETGGIIYLRDEDLQSVYKDMELNLKQYFDSQPPAPEYKNWQPGQICTISSNDYWYRGKILEVDSPTEILACMIDFGSNHILSPKNLHREILYPDIQAFASKVKLDRLYPRSGEWLSSDYDTLLEVVSEYSKVVIKGPFNVDLPLAEVWNSKGEHINELLVQLCPNLSHFPPEDLEKSDDEVALIEEEEETINFDLDNQIGWSFTKFNEEELPEEGFDDQVPMIIVNVLAYNKIVLKKEEETFKNLDALNIDIQNSHHTQPKLLDLKLEMPCICLCSEDGLWYRAQIYNIDGFRCGYIFVFFVDSGKVESVYTDHIKTMKSDWFKMPVSFYIADVNIELRSDNHLEHVLQHMRKLVCKTKMVHFISKNPLNVDLYEANGKFCYESLIKNGVLKIKNNSDYI